MRTNCFIRLRIQDFWLTRNCNKQKNVACFMVLWRFTTWITSWITSSLSKFELKMINPVCFLCIERESLTDIGIVSRSDRTRFSKVSRGECLLSLKGSTNNERFLWFKRSDRKRIVHSLEFKDSKFLKIKKSVNSLEKDAFYFFEFGKSQSLALPSWQTFVQWLTQTVAGLFTLAALWRDWREIGGIQAAKAQIK